MKFSTSKIIVAIVGIILLVTAATYAYSWRHFLITPIVPEGESVHYILPPGGNITLIANDFYKLGYLKKPANLILLSKITGDISKLKAGEYLLVGPLTPAKLLKRFRSGRVVIHHVTIIEGWTFAQMMQALAKAPYLAHLLEGASFTEIMTRLGLPNEYPEGLFFPASYQYILGRSDLDILKMAYKTMQNKLQNAWQNRSLDVPYQNPYQALIVASMVEKESCVISERPLIAGVILKRLAQNMPLQIDPTVIYGLGAQYNGIITKDDLQSDTPYNTYKYKGLPPTPISLPSMSAIDAALHPQITDALFYVATGTGKHYFSATLEEHEQAIKKYHAYETYLRSKATLPLTSKKAYVDNRNSSNPNSLSVCWYLPAKLYYLCR